MEFKTIDEINEILVQICTSGKIKEYNLFDKDYWKIYCKKFNITKWDKSIDWYTTLRNTYRILLFLQWRIFSQFNLNIEKISKYVISIIKKRYFILYSEFTPTELFNIIFNVSTKYSTKVGDNIIDIYLFNIENKIFNEIDNSILPKLKKIEYYINSSIDLKYDDVLCIHFAELKENLDVIIQFSELIKTNKSLFSTNEKLNAFINSVSFFSDKENVKNITSDFIDIYTKLLDDHYSYKKQKSLTFVGLLSEYNTMICNLLTEKVITGSEYEKEIIYYLENVLMLQPYFNKYEIT